MSKWLGDIRRDAVVDFRWASYNSLGASVAPSSNGSITIYKDNTSTSTKVGITASYNTPSGESGIHLVRVSLGSTTGFFVPGSNYQVVTSGDSIDGQFVRAVLAEFSVENRFGGEVLYGQVTGSAAGTITLPTTASGTTDLYKGGRVYVSHGTGAFQERDIVSYAGATRVATLDRNWTTTAGSADTVIVFAGSLPTTLSEITSGVLDHPGGTPAAVPAATDPWLSKLDYLVARVVWPASFASSSGVWQLWNAGSSATIALRTDTDNNSVYTKGVEA